MRIEISKIELHAIADDLVGQMVRLSGSLGGPQKRKRIAARLIEICDAILLEDVEK